MKSYQALYLFIGLVSAGQASIEIFSDQCGQPFVPPASSKRSTRTGFDLENDSQCIKLAFEAQGVLIVNASPSVMNGGSQLQLHGLEDCTGAFDPISNITINNEACISDGNGSGFKAVRMVPLTPPPS